MRFAPLVLLVLFAAACGKKNSDAVGTADAAGSAASAPPVPPLHLARVVPPAAGSACAGSTLTFGDDPKLRMVRRGKIVNEGGELSLLLATPLFFERPGFARLEVTQMPVRAPADHKEWLEPLRTVTRETTDVDGVVEVRDWPAKSGASAEVVLTLVAPVQR